PATGGVKPALGPPPDRERTRAGGGRTRGAMLSRAPLPWRARVDRDGRESMLWRPTRSARTHLVLPGRQSMAPRTLPLRSGDHSPPARERTRAGGGRSPPARPPLLGHALPLGLF